MVAAIRNGQPAQDAAALPDFAVIVQQHQSMVYSIAWHFLHERAAAEEIAQDVFLQLHRSLASFKSAEHVSHWLRKVSAHRSIDYARRQKARPQVGMEDAPEPAAAPSSGDPILSAKLRRLIASLPEKPRMVMVLRYQEDMDPGDIASALGMPVRTVKSHLARSLAMLREKIARTLPELAAAAGWQVHGGEVEGAAHEPLG